MASDRAKYGVGLARSMATRAVHLSQIFDEKISQGIKLTLKDMQEL